MNPPLDTKSKPLNNDVGASPSFNLDEQLKSLEKPLNQDELETTIRQIHIDGYERGKKQHKTPYKYTLPNDKFLKEKYLAITQQLNQARRDELEHVDPGARWFPYDDLYNHIEVKERLAQLKDISKKGK